MKTVRKTLILAACAIMLVCATIAGTLAYLTANDSVTNTFTVGNVNITLDEAKVDANGKEIVGDEAKRVKANSYKLLPGNEYDKDPTIHVQAGSEDCYVFVKVENDLFGIEGDTTIDQQMKNNGWTVIDSGNGIYGKANPVREGTDVVVFNNFTISGDTNASTLAEYANAKIEVTAYAIQAEGFDSARAAWTAAGAEAQAQG